MADLQQLFPEVQQTTPRNVFNVASPDTQAHQNPTPFLNQAQQSLLLAALNSQKPHSQGAQINTLPAAYNNTRTQPQETDTSTIPSSQSQINMNSLDGDFTPDLLDFDDNFDFDNADLGGQMIGGLPDDEENDFNTPDQHEKRKNQDDEQETGDAKRQETAGGEKGAKKPGRKPLTNEPTTKRKAQNRAAQRAFRERKEAHLKDLETKVTELTKSHEANEHEKDLLKAQVERLQVELREYRKRLSLNSGVKRSPTLSAQTASARNQMGFQFDFPKFGTLPAASVLGGTTNITPPLSNHSSNSASFNQNGQLSRPESEGRSMSPTSQSQFTNTRSSSLVAGQEPKFNTNVMSYSTNDNLHGFASTLPQMAKTANDPFGDLFSPSILKSVNQESNGNYFGQTNATNDRTYMANNGGDSTAGIPDHRVFRFNSQSVGSDTASPSASSTSQYNQNTTNSSCGTSPEPVNDSPATKLKSMDSLDSSMNNAQFSFTQLPNQNTSSGTGLTNLSPEAYNVPHVDTFDPVLFGDYRDTNDNVVGGGDFTGGFFDDSFSSAPLDFGSPSNLFGILSPSTTLPAVNAPTPSHNLMAEIDKARDGGDEDYGLSSVSDSVEPTKLISCTKIWNQLQTNPDFKDGKFDLDGLCSELRTKARCSETGLMVDSAHVDQTLKKLSQKDAQVRGGLMFEQQSWDNVLKKLTAGKQ